MKRIVTLSVFILSFLFIATSAVFGQTTIFVNSSTGNDDNDGLSATVGTPPAGPKATINAAVDTLESVGSGIVIVAENTTYSESVSIAGSNITIQGE
ncbi:MAG TPA: hypothetical protein VIL52_05740, partial [Bacteroidota bacterium]